MNKRVIIAIDGYSSCGKSSFAKLIASEMNYLYIDSGAMYRAVTLYFLRKGYVKNDYLNIEAILEEIEKIDISLTKNSISGEPETLLNGENVEREIRGIVVSRFVSIISAIAEVREHLVKIQRQIGAERGIVMDGRDIGTVVFPDADIKIFMTASIEIRAQRRYDELIAKGLKVDFEEIKNNLITRDITDENRDISPLRRAEDAVILDNSRISMAKQMQWFKKLIETKKDDR